MASNKKSYDGAHDHKQELKSGYRRSERSETDTCPIKLKLMKRHELKMFIEKQFKQYGVFDWYSQPADCTDLLYFIEYNILDKVEELYVQH